MIRPDTLNFYLKAKNWSQVQLARSSGVDKGTVNRIMKGKNKRSDSATVERIAKALGLSPEELAAPPPAVEHRKDPPESRFETTLSNSTRNALVLVARRYGMQPRVVLELAPVLFVIAAERHLAERSANLAQMLESLSAAEAASPRYLDLLGSYPDYAIEMENRAVAERDLFLDNRDDPENVFWPGYEFEKHAPFPVWLQAEMAKARYDGAISWYERDWPAQFKTAVEDALWLTEGDPELADYIASGHVALYKLKREERSDSKSRLAALQRLKAEHDAEMLVIDQLLGSMLNPDKDNGEAIA
jgi:transcriptional regulator with XRE-family HTH domain